MHFGNKALICQSISSCYLKERCLVIAEIAQAHDGSLGTAHAYIDAVARAGADAVKFQTHFADYESSAAEPFRVKFSPQDANRYDYWKRLEFTPEQWIGLADHARQCGLLFLSSPFSLHAVDVLERCGVPAWKVASGELSNQPLLDRMCATGKPVLLSSGMSGWQELDTAVARVRRNGNMLCVMQCTTAYPCPPERIGLNVMEEMRQRYGSLSASPIIPAPFGLRLRQQCLAPDALEVHMTFDRAMFGPDVPASLTFEELTMAVSGIRFIETMLANPVTRMRPRQATRTCAQCSVRVW